MRRKSATRPLVCAIIAGAVIGAAMPASSQSGAAHGDDVLIRSGEFDYAAGPASIPDGAEFSVLYGDPGEEGLFAMRLRLPAGYHIAPHVHAQPEVVTVISGAFLVGMGEEADRDAVTRLDPGSFFAFQPGHAHYAYAGEEETVIQLNSTGPWTITYIDPANDPRRTN